MKTTKTPDWAELEQERLHELLHYDPETGVFRWKVAIVPSVPAGDVAGFPNHGYVTIGLDNREYRAHRLAWLYVHGRFPPQEVDHINHDRKDNRLSNLRSVSRQENCRNAAQRSNNTSGHVGVQYDGRYKKKWSAQIMVNGKHIRLARGETKAEAIAIRKAAERQYGFHANHGAAKMSTLRVEQ